jgi:hypothetical protein
VNKNEVIVVTDVVLDSEFLFDKVVEVVEHRQSDQLVYLAAKSKPAIPVNDITSSYVTNRYSPKLISRPPYLGQPPKQGASVFGSFLLFVG